jgi:hypothetical protein
MTICSSWHNSLSWRTRTARRNPAGDHASINGGFFVLLPRVIDYIDGDDTVFERSPLERLARDGQLSRRTGTRGSGTRWIRSATIGDGVVVVIKSTLPVGNGDEVDAIIRQAAP